MEHSKLVVRILGAVALVLVLVALPATAALGQGWAGAVLAKGSGTFTPIGPLDVTPATQGIPDALAFAIVAILAVVAIAVVALALFGRPAPARHRPGRHRLAPAA